MTNRCTWLSALVVALAVAVPGTSDADNLGLCRDNVCSGSNVRCDDTCSYDGAQSGQASCEGMNPNCIRCWTSNQDTVIGIHSNFFVWETKKRDVHYQCTDGTNIFLRTECVHEIVGICMSDCQNWGQNGCG